MSKLENFQYHIVETAKSMLLNNLWQPHHVNIVIKDCPQTFEKGDRKQIEPAEDNERRHIEYKWGAQFFGGIDSLKWEICSESHISEVALPAYMHQRPLKQCHNHELFSMLNQYAFHGVNDSLADAWKMHFFGTVMMPHTHKFKFVHVFLKIIHGLLQALNHLCIARHAGLW